MRLQRACVALHFILRRMGAKPGQAAAPYGVPLRYGELDRVKLQIAVIAGINDEFSFLTLFSRATQYCAGGDSIRTRKGWELRRTRP
jgi:hypothetical protein